LTLCAKLQSNCSQSSLHGVIVNVFGARCYASAAYVVVRCLYASMRVSVWVSITFVHSVKTNKHVFTIFFTTGSHTILVFIACQHTDARYWYSKSVCPSLRPSVRSSVTFRYCM